MADHSITINNGLTFHGHGYPTVWNAFNWNAAAWGFSADSETLVTKVIDSTATPTSEIGKAVVHLIENEGFVLDSATERFVMIIFDNAMAIASDMYNETLSDGSGWNYVFPDDATNAEDRDVPTWADGAAASTSWTSAAAGSTNWS